MITPENLTKEKLANILVRKHKNLLKQYKMEFEFIDKVKVLEDKQEQLEHWLNSSKDSGEEDRYIRELEATDGELFKIKEELRKIRKRTLRSLDESGSKFSQVNSTDDDDGSGVDNPVMDNENDNLDSKSMNKRYSLKKRYKLLKDQISSEENALSYWTENLNKFIKEREKERNKNTGEEDSKSKEKEKEKEEVKKKKENKTIKKQRRRKKSRRKRK